MANVDEMYKNIGVRLKIARRQKKFTQARLAGIVGLTRTSITNIEKGQQQILVHKLYELATALNLSAEALLPQMKPTANSTGHDRLPEELSNKERKWLKSVMQGGDSHSRQKKQSKNPRPKSPQ